MEYAAWLTADERAWDRGRPVTVERAFAQAFREHEALLMGIARRLGGNAHDAAERARRAWYRYSDRGNLRSWMVAIMNNLFIDRCRKNRRTPKTQAIDDIEVPAPEPTAPPAWSSVTPQQIDAALATIGAELRRGYALDA